MNSGKTEVFCGLGRGEF